MTKPKECDRLTAHNKLILFDKTENSAMERIAKAMKSREGCLVLGVTGGIASGKTVVAKMLHELGAPLIDLDGIAREVVEPAKPAFREIVSYFGREVLQEDGSLNRKGLAKIVFQDPEKRKKLEAFTHPHIFEGMLQQLNGITKKEPRAIIQVVVPLLIEMNLEHLFHKVLVVYAPREQQIARLMKRDGITEDEAANMLKAQLPLDEKLGRGDFVVNNGGSMEETREQVEEIWKALVRLQEERGRKKS